MFITKLSSYGDQIEPKSTKADYRPIKSNCRFTILNYRPTESVYVCIKSGGVGESERERERQSKPVSGRIEGKWSRADDAQEAVRGERDIE